MPNTNAAKKALRQNKRRHQKNLQRKKKMKEAIKQYKNLINKGKDKKGKEQLSEVYKVVDKLEKVGYFNKSKSKRIKSRLAKKLNK